MSDFIFYLFSILFLVLSYQLNKTSLAIQSRDCIIFLDSNAKMLVLTKWSSSDTPLYKNVRFFTLNCLVVISKSPIVIHLPENYSSLLGFVCTANLLYQHQPPLYTYKKTISTSDQTSPDLKLGFEHFIEILKMSLKKQGEI